MEIDDAPLDLDDISLNRFQRASYGVFMTFYGKVLRSLSPDVWQRMRSSLSLVLLIIGILFQPSFPFGQGAGIFGSAEITDELLDEALRCIKLSRRDLRFRTDYEKPDPFRLSVVDRLLRHPLQTEDYCDSLASVFNALPPDEALATCARELDVKLHRPSDEYPLPVPLDGGLSSLPEPLTPILAELTTAMIRVNRLCHQALSGLSDEEVEMLREEAAIFLKEELFAPNETLYDQRRAQREGMESGRRVLDLAGKVDWALAFEAGLILAEAVLEAERNLADVSWGDLDNLAETELAEGNVLVHLESPVGPILIGGAGSTVYDEDAAIIIDPGGDDRYYNNAGGARGGFKVAVAIDLGGDDLYQMGDAGGGAGFLGSGFLLDACGDDVYKAGNFSLGCAILGTGMLLDREGNDLYAADAGAQGAGAFGIGILMDGGGNDRYSASIYSQGFAHVKGFGLLLDRGGNDMYLAGSTYTDDLRYLSHYLSLSQGVGFGWRVEASGGVGLLVDIEGNDNYLADIFGQGSSYWYAVGGLVDGSGNDNYTAYQYSQGAGTHITVAALIDRSGDDNYTSHGVSQGCGHDLALGLLRDRGGNDTYTSESLSQGAGNANGIGIIVDDAGDDSYVVQARGNTQGYGDLRRDYGSVGVFLDAAGRDSYAGWGGNDTHWSRSTYGIGLDVNSGNR